MEKLVNDFSLGLFIWQTLLFIGLVFLLKKFAWKPILDTINEREEGIKDALAQADKARQEMANIKSDNDKILKEARIERDALLKEDVCKVDLLVVYFQPPLEFHQVLCTLDCLLSRNAIGTLHEPSSYSFRLHFQGDIVN